MGRTYEPREIESKWQKRWNGDKLYVTREDPNKQKCYVLDMFPYPSGEGLHVGHPKGYIATDIYARFKRMNGYNVLHPMGWDAFGLPAEQFAIKNKMHPRIAVEKNTHHFKQQLKKIGFMYDWDRKINTTDPSYYRWTQWIFLQFFKKDLAYESYEPINWCSSCQTGLANEDLEGGNCERCGTPVEKKPMRQWVLKITAYADRLLQDLDLLPKWPESVKEMQRQWIGRSEGIKISFSVTKGGSSDPLSRFIVFTTRPDTLFGCTYCVLSPEHPLVNELRYSIKNWRVVTEYQRMAEAKTEIERVDTTKEKTGVLLEGIVAVNPANGTSVPIYVADYVLSHYGTGAIMAVPAHDKRDQEFAGKYNIPVKQVIVPRDKSTRTTSAKVGVSADEGVLVNSGTFTGLPSNEAKKAITEYVNGERAVTYRLQEWVFSRQRYWGEPIPVVHCRECGVVSVPESQLPVRLPNVEFYEPTGTGESPLADIDEWVNTVCPKCGGPAKRETNTMPQWAGSSWYYLRYIDPHNEVVLVDHEKERLWAPVDMYVGGMEHATRHLIYARFWHKFLFDIGVVSTEEPFSELKTVGLIQAEDGRKMSKRWGNVINPDEIVSSVGADALRVYEMFMGPFAHTIRWDKRGVVGSRRFIERVWKLVDKVGDSGYEDMSLVQHTIEKVTKDIETFDFNTAISAMMILVGDMEKREKVSRESYLVLIRLLAPFAPHVTEELWANLGNSSSIHLAEWPTFDSSLLVHKSVTIAIQINGKVRDTFDAPISLAEGELVATALQRKKVAKWIDGKEISRTIFIKERVVNFVTE
ncbi:MAG: Leucine--tRNA ligase [Syntrophomonadaceae bacterium]|nr:Leucine--tRNA ligase [Bacillota bacterium]